MAFDGHKNFAYSTVLTAPSPASSGTSLVVQSGDGTKFPAVPFNATLFPAGAQPTTANAEIVRVTAISTDTFTIVRAKEASAARTVVVGDQIQAGVTLKTLTDMEGGLLGLYDYVISGCAWTADSAGSTRAASMSAGVIWLGNVKLTVAAVSARTFTASKDVYVDLSDNGDGTAAITYTDTTTNAASPSLAAGSIRIAIVVVGASSIAASTSINQGEESRVLPIASSVPYAVTDSLGNLICPKDPTRRVLGYRQIVANITGITSTTYIQATGLSCPVIVPAGRRIRVTTQFERTDNATNLAANGIGLFDGDPTTAANQIGEYVDISAAATSSQSGGPVTRILTPSSSSKTYNTGIKVFSGTGIFYATNFSGSGTAPAFILVELI